MERNVMDVRILVVPARHLLQVEAPLGAQAVLKGIIVAIVRITKSQAEVQIGHIRMSTLEDKMSDLGNLVPPAEMA